MEREDIRLILDVQSKAYNDALQSFMREVSESRKQNEDHVNELQKSLEYTQKQVDDLRHGMSVLENQRKSDEVVIKELKEELAKLRNDQKYTGEAVNRLDDHNRRCNIKIDGLSETNNENPEQTQQKVRKLLTDILKISDPKIDTAYRTGGPRPGATRSIILTMEKQHQKEHIMRNSRMLKDTNIFLNDDLCPASMAVRKQLIPKLKEARQQGKIAYFSKTRLVVKERNNPPHSASQQQHSVPNGETEQYPDRRPLNHVTTNGAPLPEQHTLINQTTTGQEQAVGVDTSTTTTPASSHSAPHRTSPVRRHPPQNNANNRNLRSHAKQ